MAFRRLFSSLSLPLRLSLVWKGLGLLCRLRLGGDEYTASDAATQSGDLIISGFFNEGLGIGRAADLTHLALMQSGHKPKTQTLRHLFTHIFVGDKSLGQEGGVWLIHANAPEAMIALLAHDKKNWQHRYRIGYWAWETPEIPKDWVYACRYFHEIWVPSRYVFDAITKALQSAGKTEQIAKLKLMPHPVTVRALAKPDRESFGLDRHRCQVLTLFDCDSSVVRKNPWAAIQAWLKAFATPDPSAHLTIKISGKTNRDPILTRLNTLCANRSDISFVETRLDDHKMDQFIASFDILLSLHRSEGFGLSLAEAMRAGVVVIATEGSGNSDFMTAENSLLVPAKYTAVCDPDGPYAVVSRYKDQVWAEPDIDLAAIALTRTISDSSLRQTLRLKSQADMAHLPACWKPSALKSMVFNAYL